jgi:DNA-binding HxlR family transcriptional regulator
VRDKTCPIAEAAKLLGDKWTLILLRDLARGSCRFKTLVESGEGISPSILTGRLRELEEQGVIRRKSYNEIPPRVEYSLTDKGKDVLPVIEALRVYGSRWCTVDRAMATGRSTLDAVGDLS